MKTKTLLSVIYLVAALADLSAQSFTNINAQFPRFYYSSNTAWGDYDSDGDLDLVMCGDTTNPYPYLTRLYRNDGNNQFTPVESSININSIGDFEWGDCDNDGDADLLYAMIAGVDYANSLVIFRNDGNGDFIPETIASFENAYEVGNIAWTDWDNDGDLDFVNFPRGYSFYITISLPPQFFRNDGNGSFQTTEIALPPLLFGQIEVGDLNSDGTTDIIATGADTAFVFLNQMNDEFTVIPLPADLEYYMGNIDLADYDNDGDLDAAVIGMLLDPYIPYTINILKNDGTGNFTKITIADFDLYDSDIDFGDYDNDGDPDLIFSGFTGWWGGNPSVPYVKTEFYRNDGNDTFTFEDFGITAYGFGNQEWGDYDNDGRIDLVITGYEPPAIYQSSGFAANTPPPAPENLQVTYDFENYCFVLSWDPATDAQTPSQGLSYNVRIGSYPGGDDVLAPMARPDGRRLIPETGNAGQNTFYKFFNPPFGQYCWSVQAIDGAFAGSEFSVESSFNSGILPVVTTLPAQNVGANSAILKGIIQTGQMQVESGFMVGNNNEWNAFPATPANIPWTSLDTISLTLSSLDTNTTYQFCAFAKISDEAKELVYVYGDTLDFTTGQNPGSITGDTVTDITFYSARLHGIINPAGLSTQVGFEFGTDTTYGYFIHANTMTISGEYPVECEALVAGISPNTVFYFRVKAENDNGIFYGENKTFSTLVKPDKNFTFMAKKTENLITSYTDISMTGSPVEVENPDDGFSYPVDIGFTFNFAGADFNQFILNTNGFIKLGTIPSSDTTQFLNLPDDYVGGNFSSHLFNDVFIVSPLNHDFESGLNPAEFMVLTEGDSASRICTIQFKNLKEKTEPPAHQFDHIEFQIRLHESTNLIEFVYGNWQAAAVPLANRVAIVGLKAAGNQNNQFLSVWKWFENPWSQIEFWDGNYYEDEGWNAFNYSNDPLLMPEPGRTFRFYPKQKHDATVAEIYTLGKLPIPSGLPHNIGSYIKNTGYDTLYNIPVQLSVTGNNLFSGFAEIPVLKPDSGVVVSFTGFNPDVLGFDNVSVTLAFTDDFTPDNTKDFIQEINTNHYSYCDTSGIQFALGMVWVPGPGSPDAQWLAKYHVTGRSSIVAARIGLGYGADHQVYAVVLSPEGELLAQTENYHLTPETSVQYFNFEFPDPPVISNSDFYIGLVQTESPVTYWPIGCQREDPIRPGVYYHRGLSGIPIENSGSARLCIEAITGEAAYCVPTFVNPCNVYHYITGFQTFGAVSDIENINNGCLPYSLYNTQTLVVEPGTFFNFEVDGSFYHSQVEIWADWNCDGDFDDDSELTYFSGRLNEDDFEDILYIPADAIPGESRLRIIAHYDDDEAGGDPCGNYLPGECEDYALEIAPPSPMELQYATTFQCDTVFPASRNEINRQIIKLKLDASGTLNPLLVTGINLSSTGSTDFENDVDQVSIYYTGNYDLFSTAQLFGTSNDLNNPVIGNMPLVFGPNYFWVTYDISNTAIPRNHLDASCESITLNGFETIVPEVTSPEGRILIDYCLPQFVFPGGCDAGIGCQYFATEGGIVNISNPENGCPANSQDYSDFTEKKLIITPGSSFNFSFLSSLPNNWLTDVNLNLHIDWNNDLDFTDPGEDHYFPVQSLDDTLTGQINVPADAIVGTTRMRLITSWFDIWLPKSEEIKTRDLRNCGIWADFGEIEDYSIEITEALPENIIVSNVVVPGSTSGCFNALQSIVVAGDGKYFTAEPNSAVEFLAGQNIKFLDGTSFMEGSNVLARIVPEGPFCQNKSMLATASGNALISHTLEHKQMLKSDWCKVFPNPTTGHLTISINEGETILPSTVEILNTVGETIVRTGNIMPGYFLINLSDKPEGMYFIRVIKGKKSFTAKVIKL